MGETGMGDREQAAGGVRALDELADARRAVAGCSAIVQALAAAGQLDPEVSEVIARALDGAASKLMSAESELRASGRQEGRDCRP